MKLTRMCGYQPQYFPRLHYFNRLLASDVFEISDYVQFVKKHAYTLSDGSSKRGKSFQSHTIIKHVHGPLFLAVPTQGELLPINKTKIDYSRYWVRDHLKSIEIGYRKSPNFEKFYPELETLLTKHYNSIADLSIATTMWGITRLITHKTLKSDSFTLAQVQKLITTDHPYRLHKIFLASESTVPPPIKGCANEWCIALCQFAKANEYFYGGTSHNSYMDLKKFSSAHIKTTLQDWQCPLYPQQYSKTGFIANLSIIDLIMNTTLDESRKIITGIKTFPHLQPAKILTYGTATFLEAETIFGIMDILKLF